MDIFSNLMVIGECLLDERRTKTFKRAIESTVKQVDVVLDVGTGSGILAMFAAKAGARMVYAVEIADDIAQFARQNIRNNSLQQTVEVIIADAKAKESPESFPKDVNVLIMEMLDTGLVAEQQSVALNALHEYGAITPATKLIPCRYQCAAQLVSYDFDFYGCEMPFVIQARNFAVRQHIVKTISNTIVYRDVDFTKPIDTHVNIKCVFTSLHDGSVNALMLKAKTFLTPRLALWGTTDMNMPIIIPLPETKVKSGDSIPIHIRYTMAEGFGKFHTQITH